MLVICFNILVLLIALGVINGYRVNVNKVGRAMPRLTVDEEKVEELRRTYQDKKDTMTTDQFKDFLAKQKVDCMKVKDRKAVYNWMDKYRILRLIDDFENMLLENREDLHKQQMINGVKDEVEAAIRAYEYADIGGAKQTLITILRKYKNNPDPPIAKQMKYAENILELIETNFNLRFKFQY